MARSKDFLRRIPARLLFLLAGTFLALPLSAQTLSDLNVPTVAFRNFDSTNIRKPKLEGYSTDTALKIPQCLVWKLGALGPDALPLRVSLDPSEHTSVAFTPEATSFSIGTSVCADLHSHSLEPSAPSGNGILSPGLGCGAPGDLGFALRCGAPLGHFPALFSARISFADAASILAVRPKRESFHWGPALWQSFEFLLLEHTWRLAWDPYARYLLFHKPFWHNYLASASHFDMDRWGDGDDFLVNYIGHPLEGSVSGNIFLQNDPVGRSARFGWSSAYWKSRLKAMGWAAVYSAYFEIGPILSEAALGNEGGYTYVPSCGFYPTCKKEPGENYKPPTNNTGWVDFVVTPVIGTGWIVLEDAIEAKFVDRLAGDSPALKYKILRGALAPSRTMSNFLAGKRPWYRYSSDEVARAFGTPYKSSLPRPAWMDEPRWGLGLQLVNIALPMDWEGCAGCRVYVPGVGLTVGYRFSRYLSFDSEYNLFPGSGSTGKRGGAEEILAGLRVGRPFRSWGVFSQIRPGFIRYDKALVPGSTSDYESTTRFALDLGGIVEYYASRNSTLRFNLGTTLIHYLTGHPDPNQPPVGVLSSDYYTTQGSFRVTTGYVFRF